MHSVDSMFIFFVPIVKWRRARQMVQTWEIKFLWNINENKMNWNEMKWKSMNMATNRKKREQQHQRIRSGCVQTKVQSMFVCRRVSFVLYPCEKWSALPCLVISCCHFIYFSWHCHCHCHCRIHSFPKFNGQVRRNGVPE